ncbi:MAG: replication initiation protein [Lachnospiraceae bacterium]|nr:replication initiation protein [Lachnospiraceae bacterium]
MGKYSNFDNEMEGQVSIFDLYEPPERMVAVSNIFARARKQMSLAEQKTFVLALSHLEWTKDPTEQSNVVHLDKKTLQSVLGYTSDSTDISEHMWREIKDLAPHSHIDIADRDKGIYDSGMIITRISRRKNWDYYRVKFEEEYFPLFTGLGNKYITMWSMDIFKMTSKRSVQFYELLRQMSFDKYEVGNNLYTYGWGIKAIKEMFDIPKDGKGSYMRSPKNGGFNRAAFEKYVIEPLCEDLAKCKMIQLVIQPNGKPYEKVKKGNRVAGYQFYWTFSQRPAVAEAHEVKAIADRVEKNPQILKVAKDIVDGKKSKKPKKSQFHNFPQRDYNYEELEKILLNGK